MRAACVRVFEHGTADSAALQEGSFKAEGVPDGQNRMPVEIQVTDPVEKVLFSKDDIQPDRGAFAFTTSVAGDYIVCFHNKGLTEFMTQRRVHFTLKHGIDARDYSQVCTCLPTRQHVAHVAVRAKTPFVFTAHSHLPLPHLPQPACTTFRAILELGVRCVHKATACARGSAARTASKDVVEPHGITLALRAHR
jgi:hypothetical protein